jgi:integrase
MARERGAGAFKRMEDGRWQYRVSLGTGPDGSRQRHRFYGRTQAECREQAEEYRHHLRAGLAPPDGELLRDYLPRWLEGRAHELKPSSFIWYKGHIHSNLIPAVGNVRVTELTRRHVMTMMGRMKTRGLSARSINSARATLGAAMKDAHRDGVVEQNVVSLVNQVPQRRTEFEPLTANEIERFRDGYRGKREESLYTVELTFGLRRAELLGLTWADVDFDRGLLFVRHTLQHIGGYRLDDVKTKHSQRVIRMPAFVVDVLRKHREEQEMDRAQMGEHWPDFWPDLVFRTKRGSPIHPPLVTRQFQALLDKLGIRRRRFHDLRHTCATYLLMSGVDMKVIQQILGHSTITTTSDIYAHILPEMQENALAHMGRLLTGQGAGQPSEGISQQTGRTANQRI